MTDDSINAAVRPAEDGIESGKPEVVYLGKIRKKQIKRLKKGKGRLMGKVQSEVEKIRERHAIDNNKEFVPIVVIYRQ